MEKWLLPILPSSQVVLALCKVSCEQWRRWAVTLDASLGQEGPHAHLEEPDIVLSRLGARRLTRAWPSGLAM